MRLVKTFIFLVSCTISNHSFAMQLTDEESNVKQAIIMAKKDFEVCKNEKEMAAFLSSCFDLTNTINILDDEIKYDKDKLEYLRKKTGLNIAKIDKKVGRIVLEYEDGFVFGTGSFLNNKIVTNAHVLDGFPKTARLFFEQGISLVLPEKFDVENVVTGLNKHKSAFLNYKLYEESKTALEVLLQSSVLSKYEAKETVNVLEDYFYDIKNSDIGFLDDYTPCEGYEDFSDHTFNYVVENNLPLSSPLQKQQSQEEQSQKVFKLTHYPLGIPLQRTSYGLLDYKAQRHRMNTLGGSSGSLILNYDSQPTGIHSSALKPLYYDKMGYSVSEGFNSYQNLSRFGQKSVYLNLNKNFSNRVFSSFKSKKIKRLLLKILPMTKKIN